MMLGRLFVVSLLCVLVTSQFETTFSVYQTTEKITADGFQSETHHVTTSDGYILEMHRIPYGRSVQDTSVNRPVVFLMHGFTAASNSFIILDADHSFAYNLADAGFDIWMGNARGSKNSRYHVTLDPDDEQEKFDFFDFSFEEIGMYDLPAMIDYVLAYTGKDQLHYIGHSQGGTVFLILASMLPEYNEKLSSVHLLAGVGYQEHFPNTELTQLAVMTDIIYAMALRLGVVELFPPNSTEMVPEGLFPSYRTSDACVGDLQKNYMCELIGIRHIMRDDSFFNPEDQPGAALKQMAHYGQNIRDKIFRRYNYGIFENLARYGARVPPAYDLSLITSFVTMHYSLNDSLLHELDVLSMVNDMPKAAARQVARTSFLHEDYIVALDAKELVTDFIIEAIRNEDQENHYTVNEGVIVIDSVETDNQDIDQDDQDNDQDVVVIAEIPPLAVIEPVADSANTFSAMICINLVTTILYAVLK